MIVPAMNAMELYKEITEDGQTVMRMITTKIHMRTHLMKRTHNFKWAETLHIKTTRNNNWSVIINFDMLKRDMNMYVKAEDKQGITAFNFLMVKDVPCLIKYNAHFFKRYRERMLLTETKPDHILKRFFKHNIHITPAYSEKTDDGTMMAVISLPEGMGLGRFSESSPITEMKTFIAHDTLNKNQRDLIQTLREDESYRQHLSTTDGQAIRAF